MSRFEDERGAIEDLAPGITRIFTKKGAVRGNHYHRQTSQLTVVISGHLLMANDMREWDLRQGKTAYEPAGSPHAWRAAEDTDCLVITWGPRADDYESDTFRLSEPLL